MLAKDAAVFFQGCPLRLRDRAGLLQMGKGLATQLPPERLNRFLSQAGNCPDYTSVSGYEEEIRWHFYRLQQVAG